MDALSNYEGFVISGSPHDAYGDEQWVLQLCFLLQTLFVMHKKVIGICFGCQVLCRALGGKVGKSYSGWDVGVREVKLSRGFNSYWLITVLIIILFMGTSSRSFCKAIEMWKEESMLKKAMEDRRTSVNSRGELLIDAEYEPLVPREEKTPLQIMRGNLNIKRMLVLILVWISFLLLQIIKNDTKACSTMYWGITLLQLPFTFAVFGYECVKLYKENKKRRLDGNPELICEAAIDWTATNLAFCALCGILGGPVGGLLGSGGGFILGPLLLKFGVIPQVASATATFVMMFSSSLSVVEFYLLKRFSMPYALYLMAVSILAGFWGQYFIRKLITILKRASLIVFILSGVIFASALTMGVIRIEKSIRMINNHEFMGFLDFCSSQ